MFSTCSVACGISNTYVSAVLEQVEINIQRIRQVAPHSLTLLSYIQWQQIVHRRHRVGRCHWWWHATCDIIITSREQSLLSTIASFSLVKTEDHSRAIRAHIDLPTNTGDGREAAVVRPGSESSMTTSSI